MSARECAGSVDMSSVDCRGWRAARCSARAQETVVFPTPPFPTTNVSLATDGFYRKGREGSKELFSRVWGKKTVRAEDIECANLKMFHLNFFASSASFAVNPFGS